MDTQNLAYALIQLLHNFGAAAVLGGAAAARWLLATMAIPARRRLAGLVFAGWLLQAASGAGFGAVSYAYYHQLPDLSGIAFAALLLKMTCAASGALLAATYLARMDRWPPARHDAAWSALVALAATALAAAAFLRWFA
jgi:hypothetical protein